MLSRYNFMHDQINCSYWQIAYLATAVQHIACKVTWLTVYQSSGTGNGCALPTQSLLWPFLF